VDESPPAPGLNRAPERKHHVVPATDQAPNDGVLAPLIALPLTLRCVMEKKAARRADLGHAYEYPGARAAEAAGVDWCSSATRPPHHLGLGFNATTHRCGSGTCSVLTLRRCRRGLHTPLLIGHLPVGSTGLGRAGDHDRDADGEGRRLRARKREGGGEGLVSAPVRIVGAGASLRGMGRRGLTHQTSTARGGLDGPGPHTEARPCGLPRGDRPQGGRRRVASCARRSELRHPRMLIPHHCPGRYPVIFWQVVRSWCGPADSSPSVFRALRRIRFHRTRLRSRIPPMSSLGAAPRSSQPARRGCERSVGMCNCRAPPALTDTLCGSTRMSGLFGRAVLNPGSRHDSDSQPRHTRK